MVWTEEENKIKFVCWGKLKDTVDKEQAIVVKMGENISGIIERIDVQKNDDNEVESYKYRLKVKDIEDPVILWSNTAIKRQHESLELKEGEEVRFTYEDDYATPYGQKGRNVRVAVNR